MDEFSDDGFDDLNDNVLQELENNAIQFTQARSFVQTQNAQTQPPLGYGFDAEDDDLDDTVVIDELAQLPVRRPVEKALLPQQPRLARPPLASLSYNQPPSQVPAHSAIQQRPLASQGVPVPAAPLSQSLAQQAVFDAHRSVPLRQADGQNDILAALQARVRALEADLFTARGEASLIRSKYDTALKSHEADVARLKQLNAEQLAKQERILEAAVAAEKSAATELEFTRQDLKEELDRAKRGRKDALVATPKRAATSRSNWDVADGFDDVEILPSPSKGHGRRPKDAGAVAGPVTERTPSKGKRKRPAVDSPVMALETHSEEPAAVNRSPFAAESITSEPTRRHGALPFNFLQLALDHSGFHDRPLTFDLFARYGFPSDPDQSFASIIFQRLPQLGSSHEPAGVLTDFCGLILGMWSRCLQEKYYQPVYDLVSLLSFVIQLNTVMVAPQIVASLLPVAQETVYLVAERRFSRPGGSLASHADSPAQQLCLEIDTTGTLCVMYLTALGCLRPWAGPTESPLQPDTSASPQAQFWGRIQLEFVMMLLSFKQPPEDFLAMLFLLRTSVLPGSIGPVTGDPARDPAFVSRLLVDHISYHLTDRPKWALPGSYRHYEVRLSVLDTLAGFAKSPLGKSNLAESEVAIPRLVTVLCSVMDALYEIEIPAGVDTAPRGLALLRTGAADDVGRDPEPVKDGGGSAVTQHASRALSAPTLGSLSEVGAPDVVPLLLAIISSTILLLHTLVTDPLTADMANMSAKLAASQGGSQRYLLALARLNFAEEDLVFEAGIDAETVELAHELLELAVTPDDGEGVGEVFGL